MGHGICESFTRTAPLDTLTPKGVATDDPNIIGDQAWNLLKGFRFDPRELRGVGLQVLKLEDVTGVAYSSLPRKLEVGQQKLQFHSKTATPGSSKHASTSRPIAQSLYAPPDIEDVDLAFLEELPEEIRREIEADMRARAHNSASTSLNKGRTDDAAFVSHVTIVNSSTAAKASTSGSISVPHILVRNDNESDQCSDISVHSIESNVLDHDEALLDVYDDAVDESARRQGVDGLSPGHPVPLDTSEYAEPALVNMADPITPKKTPNVKHITKQLRPKVRTIITPAKNGLFAAAARSPSISAESSTKGATISSKIHLKPGELEDLGIDSEIFGLLPLDVQKEQLLIRREEKIQGDRRARSLSVPYDPDGTRGRSREWSWEAGSATKSEGGRGYYSRSPSVDDLGATVTEEMPLEAGEPPVAVFTEVPAVVQKRKSAVVRSAKGKEKASLAGDTTVVRLTEVNDVQAHVKKWFLGCQKAGLEPSETDLNGLRVWLVQSVAMKETLVGLEKAAAVLKWWQLLLMSHWPEEQSSAVSGERTKVQELGVAWWQAFRSAKDAVDRAMKEKNLGGRLSLR